MSKIKEVLDNSKEENREALSLSEIPESVKLVDDHEDEKELDAAPDSLEEFNRHYHINPHVKQKPELRDQKILLSVRHLKQFFFFGKGAKRQKLKAVSNVSFDLKEGECLGIVGESGCGKTTTGRSIIRLYDITSGSIYYRGVRISGGTRWNRKEIKWTRVRGREKLKQLNASTDAGQIKEIKDALRYTKVEQKAKIRQIKFDNKHVSRKLLNEIQMIFQDPIDSLDPRMTVEDIIQEGLRIQGFHNKAENHEKVVQMLETVGLVEEHASRYPHEFSGGQRQRIGIARALYNDPQVMIFDEATSALDNDTESAIMEAIEKLHGKKTLIIVAHRLTTIANCDEVYKVDEKQFIPQDMKDIHREVSEGTTIPFEEVRPYTVRRKQSDEK